jgi:hypothetical protein
VCSVSPWPASNAKRVTLPPVVLLRIRLVMPWSVGVMSDLSGSASAGAIWGGV